MKHLPHYDQKKMLRETINCVSLALQKIVNPSLQNSQPVLQIDQLVPRIHVHHTRKQKLLVLDNSTWFKYIPEQCGIIFCSPLYSHLKMSNRAVPLENEQILLQNRAVKRVAHQD